MLPRFHAPDLDAASGEATLAAEEAHHLTRVMRLAAGDEVAVFDGRGGEFRARVATADRDRVRLELLAPLTPAAEPSVPVTLVQAVLKGDAMDAVVRDATMMGVGAIVPIVSAHVVRKGRALDAARLADRWRRVALASAKQCRRASLPDVGEPAGFDAWLREPAAGLRLLLVEPSAGRQADTLRAWLNRPRPTRLEVIVGPEGGWAPAEIEQATAAGCVPVTLGGLTLRADAVALAALSVCRFVFEEW